MKTLVHVTFRLCFLGTVAAFGFSAVAQQDDAYEQAQRYMARGLAAVEMVKVPADYLAAAAEFRQATKLAPNWAAPYFNLGSVMAKAGKPEEAMQHYKRYLELAPEAADAASVRTEIYKLEYQLERMSKTRSLSGNWMMEDGVAAVEVSENGEIAIAWSAGVVAKRIKGRVEGSRIVGERTRATYTDFESLCLIPMDRSPVEGVIREDGNEVVFTYKYTDYQATWNKGNLVTMRSCTQVVKTGEGESKDVMRRGSAWGGVGIALVDTKKGHQIQVVASGSPAEAAGIRAGDILYSVDGKSVINLTLSQTVGLTHGEPDTIVTFVIERNEGGKKKQLTIPVTRGPEKIGN